MTIENVAALADETANTMKAHEAALKDAQSFYDPDLKPEVVAQKRADLTAAARENSQQALAQLATRAETVAAKVIKAAEASRPRIDDTNAAALVRAEQAWNHDVRPLLEAGAPLKAIIREAGTDELLAIERYSKGYLKAQALKAGGGPGNPLELQADELSAAINNRLSSVLPDSDRATFEEGIRAAHAVEQLKAIQEEAVTTVTSRNDYRPSAYARAASLAINLRG